MYILTFKSNSGGVIGVTLPMFDSQRKLLKNEITQILSGLDVE